jgi:hypothetical protein
MTDILEGLVLPSNICFLLTAAGLALAVPARSRRAALATLAAAGVLLVVFSCGKPATWLLSPLEYASARARPRCAGARDRHPGGVWRRRGDVAERSVDDGGWFLSPFHLQASDLAVHERVGAWWYRLRGLI